MSNMAHVRFENTYRDLKECYEHIEDENLSETEETAREELIALCRLIAECYSDLYESEYDYEPLEELDTYFEMADYS